MAKLSLKDKLKKRVGNHSPSKTTHSFTSSNTAPPPKANIGSGSNSNSNNKNKNAHSNEPKPKGPKHNDRKAPTAQKRKIQSHNDTSSSQKHTQNSKQHHQVKKVKQTPRLNSASKNEKKSGLSALQQQMKIKLQGAKFRWLNEKLYTCTGDNAWDMFQDDPDQFKVYHEGFRSQAEKWPINPVDIFINYLKTRPRYVVGDFGCGDAKISEAVSNKVHSFDLVAVNDRVTACDIAKVPLENNVLDVAIFSLSLMGTNYQRFIQEAHRCLKMGGQLKVAEVDSRFDGDYDSFLSCVKKIGFKLKKQQKLKMFVFFDFVKTGKSTRTENLPLAPLKPCVYKKR